MTVGVKQKACSERKKANMFPRAKEEEAGEWNGLCLPFAAITKLLGQLWFAGNENMGRMEYIGVGLVKE